MCCRRLLAKGDVFAVPSASTASTDSILQNLYSLPDNLHSTVDLDYFKVIGLEPSCGTACAIDFSKTNLMLEVKPKLRHKQWFNVACLSCCHDLCCSSAAKHALTEACQLQQGLSLHDGQGFEIHCCSC